MTKESTDKTSFGLYKSYYQLTKPGIVYGNLVSATAGFFLASKTNPDLPLLLQTLIGISLVIASACVFNNYIDRDIDAKMARTKIRALVTGAVSTKNALVFALFLGLAGFSVLFFYTNLLTVFLGLVAFFVYIVLYGYSKRRSVFGTLVGSIAGAMPPAAGYTAVTNNFDTAAILLFLIFALWQMPHFYAIAMYRFDEYKAASIPALPLRKGMAATKIQIILYIAAFLIASASLTLFGYTGYTYLVAVVFLGLAWLWAALKDFNSGQDKHWARKVFRFSLIVMLGLSLMICADAFLR